MHFGASQFLRLLSNLLLTRLLFPEAFGLMALVTVFLTGLTMFSETGIATSIQQNKRADEPRFLDTAWTIQIIRGGILWLLSWPIGWAAATLYDAPDLELLLPVAGLTLIAQGFRPTRIYMAQRHLKVGRLTVIELVGSVIGIVLAAFFAWWLNSVWALVLGMVLTQGIILALFHFLLDGRRDRFGIDIEIARELLHFGKWILVSTICGFLNKQGDRLILGKYLTLEFLGIYNIAYFLASFPMLMGNAVFSKVMVPYLREKLPSESHANFLAFRRIRLLTTGGLIAVAVLLALAGPHLVTLLYDSRYHAAGGIIVLICLASVPLLIVQNYAKVPLANGDSQSFAWVMVVRAALNISFLLLGAEHAGMAGAIIGLGLARILHYPMTAHMAHRYGAWDPLLDAGLLIAGSLGGLGAYFMHQKTLLEVLSL